MWDIASFVNNGNLKPSNLESCYGDEVKNTFQKRWEKFAFVSKKVEYTRLSIQ